MTTRVWTLLAVCLATFMLLLDVTVVNVALPAVQRDLDVGLTSLQWLLDAYALALAALILTAGSLADRIGRRRVFLAGLALFTVASLACGLAPTGTLLNIARALQGAGGAAMLATSLALIAGAYAPRERHVALAVWGAVSGVAIAVGPLVGGALVEAFDWRWIFLVNVPLGIVTAYLTIRFVHPSHNPSARRVDWLGGVLFSAALGALVLALLRGNADGWSSPPIVALLAACALGLIAFVAVERRVASPILDLSLWRKPTTAGASIAVFTVAAAAFAMLSFLSLYLQNTLGHGPLGTGVRLLPITAGAFLAAAITGHAGARVPARALLTLGLGLCGTGLLLMREIAPGSDWSALLLGFCVVGVGVGIVNPTVAGAAIGIAPEARAGMASGLNNTFRLLGVAVGVAGLGAIFEHQVGARFAELAPDAGPALADAVATGNTQLALAEAPAAVRAQLNAAAETAFVAGLDEILLVAGVVALLGALAAALLVRARDLTAAVPEPTTERPYQDRTVTAP